MIESGPTDVPATVPTLREALVLLMRLVRLIRGYWAAIGKGLFLGLVVGVVGMAMPYISKLLIDEVYPGRDVSLMHVLAAGVLAVSVTSALTGAIRGYYSQVVGSRLDAAARLMFFNHVQHLPTRFFEEHRVGEIMSRFQDVGSSLGLVNRALETVVLRGVYILLVPPVLFALNWKLGLLAISTMPVTTAISVVSSRVLRRHYKRSAEAYADLSAYQVEVMSQIRTLKAMAAEHRVYAGARAQLQDAVRHRLKAGGLGTAVGALNGAIRAGGLALFTWVGWTLILRGELTLGAYIAFTAYQGYLVGPLNEVATLFTSLQQTTVTFARAFEYLDEPTEQDPSLAHAPTQPIRHTVQGTLVLEHVSFGYGGGPAVLEDLDLEVPAGSILAVVGPSGAGKSSLLRLLCGLDEPRAGVIRADGVPLQAISLPDLRRQVSVVWQEVALVRGTVWDNLTLGTDAVSQADVEEAVRACRLEDVLTGLPQGYQTPVAEWGASLSGGQRQRIAIARALLRRAPVLLLDEATSNLDTETETALIRELFARLPRRTLVYATHRMATAELADRIAVLDRGRLVGLGTHAELLARCAMYRGLQQHRRPPTVTRRQPILASGTPAEERG